MLKVSVIGATGYGGAEVLRLLVNHRQIELKYITSESSTGNNILQSYPHLNKFYDKALTSMNEIDKICAESDVVFIGLPHTHAMKMGKAVEHSNAVMIDLGADYRFEDTSIYEAWYKEAHSHKDAKGVVYGLTELNREAVKTAKIIANPGCYPTASILALAPLVKNKMIQLDTIVIDAKSGTSGAGRALKLGSHFCEVNENFHAYGVASHRHTPEIEQWLNKFSDEAITLLFTPHLLPTTRGILTTSYAKLVEGVTADMVKAAYEEMYKDEFFIRLLGQGGCPEIKHVQASNFVDIGWQIDKRTGRIIVMSAIDNLVKGTAGQAIQNMNVRFGIEETEGLKFLPVYP